MNTISVDTLVEILVCSLSIERVGEVMGILAPYIDYTPLEYHEIPPLEADWRPTCK